MPQARPQKQEFEPHPTEMGFINWILDNLGEGKTIFEFGSGMNTKYLAENGGYNFYSVENNSNWLNFKHYTTYIYAPIVWYNDQAYQHKPGHLKIDLGEFPSPHRGWYDYRIVAREMPTEYDLIFVDGPNGALAQHPGRGGFWVHRHFWRKDVPIVFHDIHRPVEMKLISLMAEYLGRGFIKVDDRTGVIPC